MNKKLIILGSGGYGRTVYDMAEQRGYLITVLDDADEEYPLASFACYIDDDTEFIPAFGNNKFRLQWINKIEEAGGKLRYFDSSIRICVSESTSIVWVCGFTWIHCEYWKYSW